MQELIKHVPDVLKHVVVNQETLEEATSTLSRLNSQLDQITKEKELLTKPLNQAIKEVRDRYKPVEEQFNSAISYLKNNITSYATVQLQLAKEQEAKILADKRTNPDTKIQKLSTIDNSATDKVATEAGSITFVTKKCWRVTNIDEIPRAFLIPNEDLVKQAMKENSPIAGIEYYEEQTLRNYRS